MSVSPVDGSTEHARAADLGAGGRHIPGSTTWNIVNLVRRRAGEEGVRRLLEEAGETRRATELEDDAAWSSFWQGKALFGAATRVLGDSRALRAVGETIGRQDLTSEVSALLRSLGSPGEVLRHIDQAAAKFCTVVRMEPVEIGADEATVSAVSVEGFPRYRLLCDLTAGLLSQVSIPFDLPPATVVEEECELLGDRRCLFRVAWDAGALAGTTPEGDLMMLAHRFEAFQATAAELVSASDVETVLARITARAALAVRAPRHLLVVRTGTDDDLSVHHQGLTDDEAHTLADEVLKEEVDDAGGSRLVVDVTSARRHYGRLAALSEPGLRFFPAERRLLTSYAGLAAAALDAATALDEARAQAETASALLDLARALANVGTIDEVAQRLAAALPAVVDCDVSQVWIWDPADHSMGLVGSYGLSADAASYLRSLRVRPADTPALEHMLEQPQRLFIGSDVDDPLLAGLLTAAGMVGATVVPIVSGGRLLGTVTAGVVAGGRPMVAERRLIERLEGLADLAATAVQNAHLLDCIQHQALYDPVTSLPNKRLLEERLTQAFEVVRRYEQGFSLLFLDLDRFKNVNDSLGHDVGDELLEQVAIRLVTMLRDEDTVARLGGDEFALLLPHTDTREGAMVVAEKVCTALQEPFVVGGHLIFITSSIGIAVAPEHGDHYAGLLKSADVAMYRAKQEGRNRYSVYNPALTHSLTNRLKLEGDLHTALASGDELVAYFQPIVNLTNAHVVGVEALVRWEHPELGLLGPAEFLSLAEDSGLVVDIDVAMLRQACRAAAEWAGEGFPHLHVSVNLSDRSLRDSSLPKLVGAALAGSGMEPGQLQLEVTERVIEVESGETVKALDHLRRLGVRIAIDDFGTGSSGFSRLRECSVDALKLDKSFVHEVKRGVEGAPLLAAMIRLAHDLQVSVVGEGVETAEQSEFLQRHGCDLAQGYYFSRPMPLRGISELLSRTVRG